MPHATTAAVIALVLISATPAFAQQSEKMPVELLTIRGVQAYVESKDIRTIEHLMNHLPDVLLNNYVLMEKSTSRQPTTDPRKPRIIMFLPDGSFFMAISTNLEESSDADFDVEMLETQAVDQTWDVGALRLKPDEERFLHDAGAQVNERRSCKGCHGDNSRPIWGSYPTWPGAFGDGAGHDLTATQAQALNDALDPKGEHSNPRLQALNWVKRQGWKQDDDFILPDRRRRLSNEAMNDAVGARHVENLWKRIAASDDFELLMLTVMFHRQGFGEGINGVPEIKRRLREALQAKWIESDLDFPRATTTDKALLLLGLRPYSDLFLAKGLHELQEPEREQSHIAEWNYIAIYLREFLIVRFVEHLMREHPELAIGQHMLETDFEYSDKYANIFEYYRDNVRFMWEMDLSERLNLLRNRHAPTVDLRYEHMFTHSLQEKVVPELIGFAEELLLPAENGKQQK